MAYPNGAGLNLGGDQGEARGIDQLGSEIGSEATKTQSQIQAGEFYSASPIKRFRRTKSAVKSIRDEIRDILEKDHPQTVRQVFYALTVRGA
jgi:hypothetical protein